MQPPPDTVLEQLRGLGVTGRACLRGDDQGWTALEVDDVRIECYLASEPGIRSELNTWAAWLETQSDQPEHAALMERVIQTRQLFTLQGPDHICEWMSRRIADWTQGVWQQDDRGFLDVSGRLLLPDA